MSEAGRRLRPEYPRGSGSHDRFDLTTGRSGEIASATVRAVFVRLERVLRILVARRARVRSSNSRQQSSIKAWHRRADSLSRFGTRRRSRLQWRRHCASESCVWRKPGRSRGRRHVLLLTCGAHVTLPHECCRWPTDRPCRGAALRTSTQIDRASSRAVGCTDVLNLHTTSARWNALDLRWADLLRSVGSDFGGKSGESTSRSRVVSRRQRRPGRAQYRPTGLQR
jgi:1,2-phenylacetyl-CoA epoxidase PaaB subunit